MIFTMVNQHAWNVSNSMSSASPEMQRQTCKECNHKVSSNEIKRQNRRNVDRSSSADMRKRHGWLANESTEKEMIYIDSYKMDHNEANSLDTSHAVGVEIRRICPAELYQVKALCDDEHWNETLDYITECYNRNPSGFLGAFKLPHRYLISFCSGLPLCNSTAIVQYYLTMSGYRGQGVGSYLLSQTMANFGNRNIILNCAYENMTMFKNVGFQKDFYIFGYEKVPAANIDLPEPSKSIFYIDLEEQEKPNSCKVFHKGDRQIRLDDVSIYDGQMCVVPREKYVKSWLKNPDVQYCVAYQQGPKRLIGPVGYVAIRPSDKGHRIGPLYADSVEIAEDLLRSCLSLVSGDTLLQFYIPQQNREIYAMVKRLLKVEPSSVYARMFTKEKIPICFSKSYFMYNLDQVVI